MGSHGFITRVASRLITRALPALLCLALPACATHVGSSAPNASPEAEVVTQPRRVMVADFEVDPEAVRQDRGIIPRLERSMNGGDDPSARYALAREVQEAISATVVERLRKAGRPAEHVPPGAAPRPGDVVVTGRVLRIDEGNRTRRIGIGFGAGAASSRRRRTSPRSSPTGRPCCCSPITARPTAGARPG
jgi:hypothetical protein